MAEIIESNAGRFLHIDGYLYYKHSGDFRRYWNCRRKGECFARAVTTGYDDNLFVVKGPVQSEHNHASNREEVEAARLRGRLKRAAEDEGDVPPAQILRRELRGVPSGVNLHMGFLFKIVIFVIFYRDFG